MLGHRRTVPLWQHKRTTPLEIERSLSPRRLTAHTTSSAEVAVITAKLAQRKLLVAKHRARLSDA